MISRLQKNKNKQLEIKKEVKNIKTKNLKQIGFKFLIGFFIFLIILLCIYLYSRFCEPKMLKVNEYLITNSSIPKSFVGIKIVHISDLSYNKEENLKLIVDNANKYKPDLIIFTGDLVKENYKLTTKDKRYLIKYLKRIDNTIGKYYINGESDNKDTNLILSDSDFKPLNNSYELIYNNSLNPILITGIDSLNTNIDDAFNYYNIPNYEKIYTISLIHNPNLIKEVTTRFDVDLILAGHTHNYNINIPILNKNYYKSNFNINKTNIFISNGIGTNKFNLRLFNKPSINLYRLEKNN